MTKKECLIGNFNVRRTRIMFIHGIQLKYDIINDIISNTLKEYQIKYNLSTMGVEL